MEKIREEDFDQPFDEKAQEEGKRLFEEGGIQQLEGATESFIEVKVPFFRRFHTVWLERKEDGRIEHECSCPYLENAGSGCAHLYALMMFANGRGLEDAWGEDGPPPIIPTWVLAQRLDGIALAIAWHGESDDDEPEKLRLLPADGDHLSRVTGALDTRVLALLESVAGGKRNRIDGGGFMEPMGPWELPSDRRAATLAQAASTGRLYMATEISRERVQLAEDAPPLTMAHGLSFDLVLGFAPVEDKEGRVRLTGALVPKSNDAARPDATSTGISLDGATAAAPDGDAIAVADNQIMAVDAAGAGDWMKFLLAKKKVVVPTEDAAETLSKLATTGPLPRVAISLGEGPLPLETGAPTPLLEIRRQRYELVGDVRFVYGKDVLPPESHAGLVTDVDAGKQWQRDIPEETRLLRSLDSRPGLLPDEGVYGRVLVDRESLEDIAASLLEDGWEVRADDRAWRRPAETTFHLTTGFDWFAVEGDISFVGAETIPVARLVAALRSGQKFVTLGDGSQGLLPRKWLKKMEQVLALGKADGDRVKFGRAQALLMDDLLDSGAFEAQPEDRASFVSLQEGLRTLSEPSPGKATSGFRGELRPYQEEGLGWLQLLAKLGLGGCLADDMGLGKTVQLLAFVQSLHDAPPSDQLAHGPTLIIAPRSLLWNWREEAERFTPGLKVSEHHGAKRARTVKALEESDLVLTTYGTLQRDRELLESVNWRVLVLDEAQAIKNPRAKSTQAACALDARVRLSLTGTPVENHARDLWSQMEFLNPGLLGAERRFISKASQEGEERKRLAKAIRPLLLRRTKEQVAADLPERVEQTLYAPLNEAQQGLYARLLEASRKKLAPLLSGSGAPVDGLQGLRMTVLESLLRLRQAACHPGLVDPAMDDEGSGKISLLMDQLEEVVDGGHKALVFSQFTQLLDRVEPKLAAMNLGYTRLDGSTKDRQGAVREFSEDPNCPVFLISLKAGGTGLNLVAADYVFILDPWWNPAAEAQAIDRAHRIGRTRRVVARRLVARGTVEERILELQARKRELAEALVSTGDSGPSALDAEDLRLLLA